MAGSDLFDDTGGLISGGMPDLKESVKCLVKKGGADWLKDLYILDAEPQAMSDHQIDKTMSGDMLVTAFGEAVTTFGFRVLSTKATDITAISEYKKASLSFSKKPDLITIVYGKSSAIFQGYLVGCKVSIYKDRSGMPVAWVVNMILRGMLKA